MLKSLAPLLMVAGALVRHEVVECVGPNGRPAEGHGDGRVVREELVRHHLELPVGAHQEVRGPHTYLW